MTHRDEIRTQLKQLAETQAALNQLFETVRKQYETPEQHLQRVVMDSFHGAIGEKSGLEPAIAGRWRRANGDDAPRYSGAGLEPSRIRQWTNAQGKKDNQTMIFESAFGFLFKG